MTTAQTLMTFLLLTVLLGIGFSYYSTRQRMLAMRRELDKLQAQARSAHACSLLRNERARCHLELQALEADIGTSGRTALSAEQIKMVETNRTTIKDCVEALKQAGDWLGLPFDLEWLDMLDRLPHLDALYRASLDNSALLTDVSEIAAPEPGHSIDGAELRADDNVIPVIPLNSSAGGSPNPDPKRTF
jgi:hypothetical protein